MSKSFEQFLSDPYAVRHYLVEIEAFDPAAGQVVTFYFSDHGYTTSPEDEPAHQYYEPRLVEALNFQRSMFQPGAIGGVSIPSFGEIRLTNGDGGLDFLRTYALDGRRVVVRLGGEGFALKDFEVIFDGTAQSAVVGEAQVSVRLRDLQYKLTKPAQENLYLGPDMEYFEVSFHLFDGPANRYHYMRFKDLPSTYVLKAGDVLEYEIWWDPGDPANKQIAVDLGISGGTPLRGTSAADQNGLPAHPATDLTRHASGKWYARSIPIPPDMIGNTVAWYMIACEENASQDPLAARLRNLEITDGNGGVQQPIWKSGDPAPALVLAFTTDPGKGTPYSVNVEIGGDLEGGEELEGRTKPLCYGRCLNVKPALVDAAQLIYQVHDGPIDDVTAVYDRGAELLPRESFYEVDTARGTFRLLSAPTGTDAITADVRGDAEGGYVSTVADLARRVVTGRGGLEDPGDLDTASFDALNAADSSEAGLYLSDGQDVLAVLDGLLGSVGGHYGFDRRGRFQVGRFEIPQDPSLEFRGQAGDHVIVSPFPFPTTELTVELWMRTDDDTSIRYWLTYASAGSTNDFIMGRQALVTFHLGNVPVGSGVAVNDGQWHHVAVTWRSKDGLLILYVDGEKRFETVHQVGFSFTPGGALVFGQEQDAIGGGFSGPQAFLGRLRDVRVWALCRTEGEIRRTMEGELTGSEKALVGWWPLGEGRGGVAGDASSGDNFAAITGCVWHGVPEFTPVEILEIERIPVELPAWRQRVGYRRNWTVLAGDAVAGVVSEEHRAFLAEDIRVATAEDEAIRERHLLAGAPESFPGLLLEKVAGEAEAARRLHIYGRHREMFRVTVKTQPFGIELNATVRLVYPRFGLERGKSFRVVGLEERAEVNRVTMELWG